MHSVAQFGSDIPAMVLVLVPLPNPCTSKIRESRVENRESILYSGQEKVAVQGTTDEKQELQAAENRQFLITSSEGTPEKRPNYKGTLDRRQVNHGDCRTTHKVE